MASHQKKSEPKSPLKYKLVQDVVVKHPTQTTFPKDGPGVGPSVGSTTGPSVKQASAVFGHYADNGAARKTSGVSKKDVASGDQAKEDKVPEEGTGMASPSEMESYVAATLPVITGWGKLSAEERVQKLLVAANARLRALGVPPIKTFSLTDAATPGSFSAGDWAIQLSEAQFQKTDPDLDSLLNIVDTVYHEARHAEQAHRVARLRATQGRSAAEIAAETGIPLSVAKDAVSDAKKHPLDPTSTEGKEAQRFYDSSYGKDKHKTESVYRKQDAFIAQAESLVAAFREKQTVLQNGSGTEEEKAAAIAAETKAAHEELKQLREAAVPNHEAYLNLPEEKDAHATGDAVEDLLRQKMVTSAVNWAAKNMGSLVNF